MAESPPSLPPLLDQGSASDSRYPHLVFVYGTLKTGYCRNHYLAGYNRLGEFWTRPIYRLFDCGEYPALVVDADNGRSVAGEVWAVDDAALEILDRVEAVTEGLYRRVVIELSEHEPVAKLQEIADGKVQGYVYNLSVAGLPECGDRWSKAGKH